jgi:ubiquinone/menaquinone biosynthesis C-methylase UbiE
MSNRVEAYTHLLGQSVRTGYYAALYRLTTRQVQRLSEGRAAPGVKLTKPVPATRDLLRDVIRLQARDAENIREGIYPLPVEPGGSLADHIEAVRAMFADLPKSNERRVEGRADEAASLPQAEGMPEYYAQNFHYQSGGYLTAESARLYDVQVETLFFGAAAAMRRQAIRPIAEFMRGRDQRQMRLLDVACGSGRFLGQLTQAFPAMAMTGTDLSQAYLDEAVRYLADRRNVDFRQANAEAMPFDTAHFDIATCIYLYHELPRDVRRRVTGEIARVLKPGGLFVFVDSLQTGDVPGYDGLLEAFPQRFHEPYFDDYLEDDLAGAGGAFASAGLEPVQHFTAFLSKIVVCRRLGA